MNATALDAILATLAEFTQDVGAEVTAGLILAALLYIAKEVHGWVRTMFRMATPGAFVAMLLFGWDPPSGVQDDHNPLPMHVKGEAKLTFREVYDEQMFGGVRLAVAVRWAVLGNGALRIGGPLISGEGDPFSPTIVIGALVVVLLARYNSTVNFTCSIEPRRARVRIGLAGGLMLVWSMLAIGAPTTASLTMFLGIGTLGVSLVTVACRGRISGAVRPYAAAGWILGMVGEGLTFAPALTESPIGFFLLAGSMMLNVVVAVTALRTSRTLRAATA